MTQTRTASSRAFEKAYGVQFATRLMAASALTRDKLVEFTSGNVQLAGYDSLAVAGAVRHAYSANAMADVLRGNVILTAGGPITAGQYIKSGISGVAFPVLTTANAGTTLDTSSAGVAFTNQPANDGIELVSSDNGDTMDVTLYGTTTGTDTVVVETVTLTGTTQADAVKTDWGQLLAASISSAPAGTVTIREASGNATITTLTSSALTRGLDAVTTDAGWTLNNIPGIVASGATTKQIGLIGLDSAGATIYDSQALNGATVAAMNTAFYKVTYFMTGDLEATRTVSLSLGATAESGNKIVGQALTTAAAAGDTFVAWIY